MTTKLFGRVIWRVLSDFSNTSMGAYSLVVAGAAGIGSIVPYNPIYATMTRETGPLEFLWRLVFNAVWGLVLIVVGAALGLLVCSSALLYNRAVRYLHKVIAEEKQDGRA